LTHCPWAFKRLYNWVNNNRFSRLYGLRDQSLTHCTNSLRRSVQTRRRRAVGGGLGELCRRHTPDGGVARKGFVGKSTDIPCAFTEGIDYPATEVSGTVAHLL
jgi:hypothetical protein